MQLNGNPATAQIIDTANLYLAESAGATTQGSWLDASAQGDYRSRGQSLLVPQPVPAPIPATPPPTITTSVVTPSVAALPMTPASAAVALVNAGELETEAIFLSNFMQQHGRKGNE